MNVGIHAINFYLPKTYLPIEDLAAARDIAYAKLNKGLGLNKMAVPDLGEDVATMAAQAVIKLLKNSNINPKDIGRLYLGTESALDAAKPTATYVAGMVEAHLAAKFGNRALMNCDVVDLTFACVGAIDALENALDWVRANPNRQAIVVAADVAKYDLGSTGEYTQGAGAVAILVKANPDILSISPNIGVAVQSVGDFFKPRRTFSKIELLQQAAQLLGTALSTADADQLLASATDAFWGEKNAQVELHKDEPVFDGPYSNQCYQDRIAEALADFNSKQPTNILNSWSKLIFHLPYAYQGRRMIVPNWIAWMKEAGNAAELQRQLEDLGVANEPATIQGKAISKSESYQKFVANYVAQGERASAEIGNMYTASIFMSLLSLLADAVEKNETLTDKRIGFFAYGSGSKAKILEGTIQPNWAKALQGVNLFETLDSRVPISFAAYENWHRGIMQQPFVANNESIKLSHIGAEGAETGYRYYH